MVEETGTVLRLEVGPVDLARRVVRREDKDRNLTTKEAESRLIEAGHTGEDRKSRKDSWSALILLEDWMRAGEPMD